MNKKVYLASRPDNTPAGSPLSHNDHGVEDGCLISQEDRFVQAIHGRLVTPVILGLLKIGGLC